VSAMEGKPATRIDGVVRSDDLSQLNEDAAAKQKGPPAELEAPQTLPARGQVSKELPSLRQPDKETDEADPPQTVPARVQEPPKTQPPAKTKATEILTQEPAETREQPAVEVTPPGDGAVKVSVKRNGDGVTLTFPFAAPTPAAVFRRADALWL